MYSQHCVAKSAPLRETYSLANLLLIFYCIKGVTIFTSIMAKSAPLRETYFTFLMLHIYFKRVQSIHKSV